jgi:FemAB-related protein (PEP-CTERM system-associated)
MNVREIDAPHASDLELGFAGGDTWAEFVRAVYGYKVHRLVASDADGTRGALTLLEFKHPVFGHYLATAPYGSYGGFAFESATARDALLEAAARLTVRLGAEYVNVRALAEGTSPPEGWTNDPIYCTFIVDMPASAEEILKTFSPNHRNHVRKSLKKNFSVRFGRFDLLDDVYKGLSRSMHELGSPYHSKAYLKTMAERLGENLEFAVMYDAQKKICGSGVFIYQGETVSNLHANILKDARSDYAGEFLYWSVIERGIEKNLKAFDLGRSLIGSGNETFKMKWAPRRLPLDYWYWLAPNHSLPSVNQHNPKFRLAVAVWKKLPAFIVNTFGHYLIRGLA